MAILDIQNLGGGNFAGGINKFLSVDTFASITIWIFGLSVIALCVWIIFSVVTKWAKAQIYEIANNGTIEYKQGVCKRVVDRKTKAVSYIVKTRFRKETIPEDIAKQRYIFRRGYVLPMMRLEDGRLRGMHLVTEYVNPTTKQLVPYAHPINNNLVDHIWHDIKQDAAKYKLTTTAEKLAPYATFALVAVMSMLMWYVTNGK